MKPARVLLVEDSPVASSILKEMLSGWRAHAFEVDLATRLDEALESLAGGEFDAVLLNLGLPDSDGLDTIRKLHARFPKLPVVVLSGLDEITQATDSLREGAQDYLVKGQTNAELLSRAVLYAIDSKRLEQERTVAERMRGIVELAGAICHKLNQPLQVISGQAEMLKIKAAGDEQVSKRATRIQEQTQRMAEIIAQLSNMTSYVTQDYADGGQIVDIDGASRETGAREAHRNEEDPDS